MSTPKERDPQLVEALAAAIEVHGQKHFYAGRADGLRMAMSVVSKYWPEGGPAAAILRELLDLGAEAMKNTKDQAIKGGG